MTFYTSQLRMSKTTINKLITSNKMSILNCRSSRNFANLKAKLPLVLFIIFQLFARWAQSSRTNIDKPTTDVAPDSYSNFRDPIVWNEGSLYKDEVSSSSHLLTSATRIKRSTNSNQLSHQNQQFADACQSKMEILTPYYALNSKGKLRTIINSELMQQAIQVETCIRLPPNNGQSVSRCNAQLDCGCEQKYKWHRLLVLDPKDAGASQGLFMDWFLFPSSCVCRCKSNPSTTNSKQFLRAIKRISNAS